ncbi:methylaspartate mutase [Streptomyces sp. NPDC006207]
MPYSPDRFSAFVRRARAAGRLVVQPRMGFGELDRMRAGLRGVREARATSVGTITLDSYTRCHDYAAARRALRDRAADLNGFPLIAHGPVAVKELLAGTAARDFPVQVRHGTALPLRLFRVMAEAGIDATEGGPVSYCLPYSRTPLAAAVREWREACELLAGLPVPPHLETFGGCMLGQLCPPSLLVALSVLEGMFFREHGLTGISLSYAQQVHPGQDLEALAALRRLAAERLADTDRHLVLYTFMGVFPRTPIGSYRLLEHSVRLAVRGGAERLVVKTPAESHRIPTVEENVEALEFAHAVAESAAADACAGPGPTATGLYEEARTLVDAALGLGDTVGDALVAAFARGVLDVPYCLHPDNADRARAAVDPYGVLRWTEAGAMPVTAGRTDGPAAPVPPVTARGLGEMLSFNERHYDREDLTGASRPLPGYAS